MDLLQSDNVVTNVIPLQRDYKEIILQLNIILMQLDALR